MSTGFRSLHPLPCFLYYAGVMLLSMLLLHPIYLTASVVLMILLHISYEGDQSRGALRMLLSFLLIGLFLFLLNPLFSHRGEHILFYFMDQPVTLEAIEYGLTLSLSTLSLLFAFMSYRQVITSDKFLYLFSSIWPKGTLVMMMAMRFVPLLQWRLRIITQMQRTKGISIMNGPLKKRIGDGMKLLQVLLTWSLEEALQTADSMKARGFGRGPRSTYTAYRMRSRDWTAVVVMVIACLICIAGRIVYGYGQLTIYPRLETIWLSGAEWFEFAIFVLFVGTPLLMDGKEWARWHFLK